LTQTCHGDRRGKSRARTEFATPSAGALVLERVGLKVPRRGGDLSKTNRLKKCLTLLGGINFVCLAVQTILSYGLAPITPFHHPPENTAEFLGKLAQTLAFLGPKAQAFVSGQSVFARQSVFLAVYCLPLLISTGVFLALLILLARHHQGLTADAPRMLFRWAAGFACASLLASPVLVKDFWLSLVWGRMAATGVNPYYAAMPVEMLRTLPVGQSDLRMTYGPLWAVISAAIMWLSGEHIYLAALLFKLLLAAAWVWSVWLVWRLLEEHPLWNQCVGIAIFGWVPLSVTQIVADGHNDIVMVLFLLLWLYWLKRGDSMKSVLALASSVLTKYTTAPLFFLDLLQWRPWRKRQLLTYLPRVTAAALFMLLMFGLYYRSRGFFASTFSVKSWDFFTPSTALEALQQLVGIHWWRATQVLRALFLLLAGYSVVRYWLRHDQTGVYQAALAILSAEMFGLAGHVWPWYLLWLLGGAALAPKSALARWVIGLAVASPFPILVWVVYPDINPFSIFFIPSLALYAFSVLWLALVPRRWFPQAAAGNPVLAHAAPRSPSAHEALRLQSTEP